MTRLVAPINITTSAPLVTDDINAGYLVGYRWLNTSALTEYVCTSNSVGAAVWTPVGTGGGGSSNLTITTTTSNSYNILTTNDVIHCDASGITSPRQNIILYTAVGNTGKRVYIKKIDSTPKIVEVDGINAELVDGNSYFPLTDQWQSLTLISTGTGWDIF
jgi:hypothetical protein